MRRVLPFVIPLLLVPGSAFAGGFLIYEHGAKGTGMASARTASSDDVSALYFNPAAITELEGLQLGLGFTGILPSVEYDPAGNPDPPRTYLGAGGQKEVNDGLNATSAKMKGYTPIHLYASYRLEGAPLAFGIGVNNPFGLGSYWPGDWDGRFIGTETEIQTFFTQPVVALDIAELGGFKDSFKLAVSAGYDFIYSTARLSKRIDLRVLEPLFGVDEDGNSPEGEMRMTGSATGHGWTASLYAELPGIASFGAAVRGGFKEKGRMGLPLSGTAKFVFLNEPGQRIGEYLEIPPESGGEVTVDLPLNMNFGVAFLMVENLKIAVDFYIAFFESFKEIHLHFDCLDLPEGERCDTLEQAPIAKNWKASWQLSVGVEYVLFDSLALRAGYGTVSNPVPDDTYDPSLPDGTRHLICVGAGYQGSWWGVDLGYMLAIWSGTKDNTVGTWDDPEADPTAFPGRGNPNGMANGTYDTLIHLIGLSLTAHFL